MNNLGPYNYNFGNSNGAPLNYNIGKGISISYADKILEPGGASTWRHQPNNVPLRNQKMFVPQGTQIPLAGESRSVLPVPNSMFYFNENQVSMACCPSTYTTSDGCVCTTPQQRKYIGEERGGNSNYPTNPTI